jgi:hypothetical protein
LEAAVSNDGGKYLIQKTYENNNGSLFSFVANLHTCSVWVLIIFVVEAGASAIGLSNRKVKQNSQ